MRLNKFYEEDTSEWEDDRFQNLVRFFSKVRPTKGITPIPMEDLEDFMLDMSFEEAFKKIAGSKDYSGGRFNLNGTHFAISPFKENKGSLLSFSSNQDKEDYMYEVFYLLGGTEEDLS